MAKILWTPAGEAEALAMGPRLRKADLREMQAISGKNIDPGQHLATSVRVSRAAYVGRDADDPASKPFVIYGVVDDPTNEGFGAIWLVATPQVHDFRRALLEDAPKRIKWIHERRWYPRGLHNLVDSRNKTHVKWLLQMGALFPHDKKAAIIRGVPFLYFRFIDSV